MATAQKKPPIPPENTPPRWLRLDSKGKAHDSLALLNSCEEPIEEWESLLRGKGSPTQHIRAITGGKLGIELIDMSLYEKDGFEPPKVNLLRGSILLRQVWGLGPSGERLFYAASWWEAAQASEYLPHPDKPIWDNLAKIRPGLTREINTIHRGRCPELEQGFGLKGPLWGRDYGFWHGENLVAVIYEVFSPAIAHYWQAGRTKIND